MSVNDSVFKRLKQSNGNMI